jgi:His/Glu/Gln/Arg/opine family amino acid ABC transporter permease subunit
MSHQPSSELFYVAPPEAPPSRRPPLGTVGLVGWLRKNLFNSPLNSVITLITLTFVVWFLWVFLSWSIQDAQWSVVINNLNLMNVGLFDSEEIWRIELMATILIFLSGLGLALWGGTTRAFLLTIVITMFLVVLIPIAAQRTQPAPIRFLVGERGNYGPMRIPLEKGESFTVGVEALNANRLFDDPQHFAGLMESAPGTTNSRIIFTEIRRAATLEDEAQRADLSTYNLLLRVQVTNAQNQVLAEVISSHDEPNMELEFTAKETTWYIVKVDLLEEAALYQSWDALQLPTTPVRTTPNTGHAFIRLDNVPVYRTRPSSVEKQATTYGVIPAIDGCDSNDPFACQTSERIMRFEGKRNFGQFLNLQVEPYLNQVTIPLLTGVVVFFLAYFMGSFAAASRDPSHLKWMTRITTLGWVLLLPMTWVVLSGVEGAEEVHPLLQLKTLSPNQWQGLTLTLILTFISVVASLPLGVLLALGRRSSLPVIGTFSVLFIELVRGAPLITILFFAKNIVPFFFSEGADINDVLRMLIGLTLFSAAYQAEIVRGGLQIIPKGQTEASQALGLNPFFTNAFIILPQALRAVIPATMSQFVSLFKDTSLVSVIGVFELLGIVELIVTGQQQYRPFVREAYLYIGIIYFVIAFMMSAISRRLEESGSGAARRR